MSLPRPVRMRQRRDFEAVRQRGTSVGGRLMALAVLANEPAARAKIGVIVPKALGCAPVRNRLKRQLREIVRHALPTLEASTRQPPVCVTIARRASVQATFAELHQEWHRLARKAGLTTAIYNAPAAPATRGAPNPDPRAPS